MAPSQPLRSKTALLVGVVAVVLVASVGASGSALAVGDSGVGDTARTVDADAAGPGASLAAADLADPDDDDDDADNDTQQVNPDSAGEDGDEGAVLGNLASSMAGRLTQGQIAISEGQYDAARGLFGDEYDEDLGMYVDVAGETEGSGDDTVASEFREARKTQRELANQTKEFETTYEQYQRARRNGNEQRARELARELQRQREVINRTASELDRTYETIANRSRADLSTAQRNLAEVRENVTERVATVERDLFVATRLAVTANRTTVSFADPVRLTGRLTTENGSVVANRSVRIDVGPQTIVAETDANGTFDVTYRPVRIPAGEQTVAVTYRPRNTSQYLGTSAPVTFEVRQLEPTLTASVDVDTVGYGDRMTVTGNVSVAGIAASGVPLDVYVGDERLGRVTTGPDGTFEYRGAFPAKVPAGEQDVRVEVALEGAALASVNVTRALTVEETATTMSLSATRVAEGSNEFSITGQVVTADGDPVANQVVALSFGESGTTTVRTDADGEFQTRLSAPESLVPGEGEDEASAVVTAALRTDGTNLLPDEASTSVTLVAQPDGSSEGSSGGDPSGSSGDSGSGVPIIGEESGSSVPLHHVALGLGTVLVGGVVIWRRRYAGREATTEQDEALDPEQSLGSEPDSASGVSPSTVDPSAVGTESAIRVAYATVRQRLEAGIDVPSSGTHWEFVDACRRAGLDDDRLEELSRLVGLYERVVFGPDELGSGDAAAARDAAASLLGDETDGDAR